MEKIWLKNYPKGVNHEIDMDKICSVIDLMEKSVKKYGDNVAYENFGATLTFSELDKLSNDFASFLTNVAELKKGDRIALQMPNLLQYPVALFGALKSGLIVVNTNPLYTEKEMLHQFDDSEVKAIVILDHFTNKLEKILDKTKIETVIETGVGDLLGWPKSWLINGVLKHVKKMVPEHGLKKTFKFRDTLNYGSSRKFSVVKSSPEDLAFLQYTGGTTGVAKGAELTHSNVVANMFQMIEWMKPRLIPGEEVILTPLPLYHIFSLTVNCLGFMYFGGKNLLITNPRDIPKFIKLMKTKHFTLMSGVNTLYNALINNPSFRDIDFSSLKLSVAGGMALQKAVSVEWKELTGTSILEGYGLTETSPITSCNPIDGTDQVGTIGLPMPSTDIKLIDDDGKEVAFGERGEICVKGPQVMKGYWKRPEDTKDVMPDGEWLKTGDIAIALEGGFFKIVDRKKDMILVSGFNVYPNEVEDVIASHPKVLEVAAVGVPSQRSGEAVKIFVVKKDQSLTKEELKAYAKESLTGYKTPDFIEFRDELPKSNVGKILRRPLREEELKKRKDD